MGKGHTFIIAEAGVNHNGSVETAKKLIDVAAKSGADAVKFQSFKAEKVASRFAPKAKYQLETTSKVESQLEMLKKLELNEEAHGILIDHCKSRNICFISTPFDFESLWLLVKKFDLQRLKIASPDLINAPLLLAMARSGKQIILSTGMATLGEVETALCVLAFGYIATREKTPSIKAFREAYCLESGQGALKQNVVLLHCTSEYPAAFKDVNLKAMDTLQKAFGLPVGLSDHTQGIAIPIAAVSRGAIIIEKHFTLDRNLPGPDHKASLEPRELETMVKSIRQVEQALGSSQKIPAPCEISQKKIIRKSIVAARDIKKGEILSEEMLAVKRPGIGIPPIRYWEILGLKAGRDYQEDELLEL